MPLDSKWGTEDASSSDQRIDKVRTPRKSKKVPSRNKPSRIAPDSDVEVNTDSTNSESEWSRPSSSRRNEIFDKGRNKTAHLSKSSGNEENPLAKALGITLDQPCKAKPKTSDTSEHKFRGKNMSVGLEKKNMRNEGNIQSLEGQEISKTSVTRAEVLKKRIDDQRKLLEVKKHKAQQQELINNFLEGDSSFDWEDDETELIKKLVIKD